MRGLLAGLLDSSGSPDQQQLAFTFSVSLRLSVRLGTRTWGLATSPCRPHPTASLTKARHTRLPPNFVSSYIPPCRTDLNLACNMDEGLFIMCIVTFLVLYVILPFTKISLSPRSHITRKILRRPNQTLLILSWMLRSTSKKFLCHHLVLPLDMHRRSDSPFRCLGRGRLQLEGSAGTTSARSAEPRKIWRGWGGRAG